MHRVYVFIQLSWRRTDFVVLTRKNIVVILQRDIGRHTGTLSGKLWAAFKISISSFRYHSFFSFTRTSSGLNIVGNAPFTTFFNPTQGLDVVFGDEMLRTCVGRGRLNLLVSSPAKGAPFLSKLFLNRKIEKGEIWSLFGIVFAHGNGTIPQFHLFRFQNKRLCCVFIPLSLVLML